MKITSSFSSSSSSSVCSSRNVCSRCLVAAAAVEVVNESTRVKMLFHVTIIMIVIIDRSLNATWLVIGVVDS